ncbi:hypothetical protein LTR65_001123 [Meristemomyces frigidus]
MPAESVYSGKFGGLDVCVAVPLVEVAEFTEIGVVLMAVKPDEVVKVVELLLPALDVAFEHMDRSVRVEEGSSEFGAKDIWHEYWIFGVKSTVE